MAIAALLIGLLIAAQGVLGLAAPELFASVVMAFQTPPVIYLAAVIRIAFGVVLVLAASTSRLPIALRCLGILIAVGGLMTPLLGVQFSKVVFAWWSQGGPAVIRAWAALALAIGVFIIYAVAPRQNAA